MRAQDALKAVELDLTGADISVVMAPLSKGELSQRFGFIGVNNSEDLKYAVERHLGKGSNYATLDGQILVDSQHEYQIRNKSITFFYNLMKDNLDGIILRVRGTTYSTPYEGSGKISFRELPKIATRFGLKFAPVPETVEEIYRLEGFGREISKPSEAKAPVPAKPIVPTKSVVSAEPLAAALTEVEPASEKQGEWLLLNGIRVKRQELQNPVVSPKIRWVYLKDYDLSRLEEDFGIAAFERNVRPGHVREILNAILKNEFYDPIVKAVDSSESSKNRFGTLDAQHRLVALKTARDAFGLKKYDLMVMLYDKEYARRIYQNVNLGKPLTPSDRSKAWDTGTIPFFNVLGRHVSHYASQSHMSFIDILHALHYKNHGTYHSELKYAEKQLSEVTPEEVDKVDIFLTAAKEVWGSKKGNPMYRVVVFRNVLKLFFESDISHKKLSTIMEGVQNDQKIIDVSRQRDRRDFRNVYGMIKEHAAKTK